MKTMLLVSTLLLSQLALAYPTVNDRASFTGTYSMNGQAMDMKMSMTLVSYDSAKDSFLETQEVVMGGQTEKTERWVEAGNYASQELANDALTNCNKYGGNPEAIVTPAGEFKTCHLIFEDSQIYQDYWIADLPFAIAKIIQKNKEDGSVLDLVVESYSAGQ